ncbi:polysaccharide biosynthesis/export family protein [Bordetella sp. 15P40C-2]|uniref:polysaccharide biosynthesis/export family protein n=1 Tax=Bordetella sp. 15P40C-2 TaxID=2572246 RepID=UPI0013264718|nr:polysaccharide biosynthesis/export family protein [Bordetella sp. 15P40C-2]MVW73295.1 sugar transporter [Bordetella sp. 15P40C-2]
MSLGLVVLLSGCAGGILSGTGPRIGAIVEAPEKRTIPYELVDLAPTNIASYARLRDETVATTVSSPKSFEVRLIPGDVLQVMIADIGAESAVFAPLAAGGTKFEARVDSAGKISLPYAGRFSVAGKTLVGVEEEIRRRLKGVASDPQVMVNLLGDVSGSVLVAGAVKQPGRFSALQGPLTLLDAINLAGGPLLEPHLVSVTVRNGKEAHVYSYQSLLNGLNRPISPRSEIVVSRAKKRFVAMGAVKAPGLHDLPSDQPSLLEVLGQAGWLDDASADPQGVFVFRLERKAGEAEPVPEVFRLNMRDPAAIFLAKDFLVKAEDAVYVTNAAVHEWQKIITPIVQAMAFGRTLQSGF